MDKYGSRSRTKSLQNVLLARKYTLLTLAAICTILYYFADQLPDSTLAVSQSLHTTQQQQQSLRHVYARKPPTTLAGKIERADLTYERTLRGRAELIKQWTPKDGPLVNLFIVNSYTIWDFFVSSYNCPWDLQRLGALGTPGKWTCGLTRLTTHPTCTVYSIGTNSLSASFEARVLQQTQFCDVYGYESAGVRNASAFGPEVGREYGRRARFDGKTKVAVGESVGTQLTLEDLMAKNGHTHIDILKLDLPGRAAFDLVALWARTALAQNHPLPFAQLIMEINIEDRSFKEILEWWNLIEKAGLRPFMNEFNLAYKNLREDGQALCAPYSFLNRVGPNVFMTE